MAATKTLAYTAEQTVEMVSAYVADPSAETVATLAEMLGKTTRSVIAKLSREGVYVKKEYVRKDGSNVQKKDDTADAIGRILKLSEGDVSSLTKANKKALDAIFAALANSVPISE